MAVRNGSALAAGNRVILKPAEQRPRSIMVLADMIADLLQPGVLDIVNGFGVEASQPLAPSKRIAESLLDWIGLGA